MFNLKKQAKSSPNTTASRKASTKKCNYKDNYYGDQVCLKH